MSNLRFAIYWAIAASCSIGFPLSLVHIIVNVD